MKYKKRFSFFHYTINIIVTVTGVKNAGVTALFQLAEKAIIYYVTGSATGVTR
jgi:hypothetical protein